MAQVVTVRRVVVSVVLGSGLGGLLGGCVAKSAVVGEEATDAVTPGSVELIGNATYFVETLVQPGANQPQACLPRPLPVTIEGDVRCTLFRTSYVAGGGDCSCESGSTEVSVVEERLELLDRCGGNTGIDCADYCICRVQRAEGQSADDCMNNRTVSSASVGWCYVDPVHGRGSGELVSDCPATQTRIIRVLPEEAVSTNYVLACLGGPVLLGPTEPGPGPLGTPCFPGLERNHDFNGFSLDEVAFALGSPDCESNTCLVNHFQGRASCPYGQTSEQAASDRACFRPGPDGQVTVPVEPQLEARRAEDNVICSCRCNGPDRSASYCDCPSDMECAPLVPYGIAPNSGAYVGGYCIKKGTRYDPEDPNINLCNLADRNCGDPP
jgi:hypothetical protein